MDVTNKIRISRYDSATINANKYAALEDGDTMVFGVYTFDNEFDKSFIYKVITHGNEPVIAINEDDTSLDLCVYRFDLVGAVYVLVSLAQVQVVLRGVKKMLINQKEYLNIVDDIKTRIRTAQYKAVLGANKELMELYWHVPLPRFCYFLLRVTSALLGVHGLNQKFTQCKSKHSNTYF